MMNCSNGYVTKNEEIEESIEEIALFRYLCFFNNAKLFYV